MSERRTQPTDIVFVGGPGRSGTSFVADRLGRHPDICTFPNVELKLFTEKNGLLDLYHALVETYSPNRATVALDQFNRFFEALVDGRFGQSALTTFAVKADWLDLRDRFVGRLCHDGQPGRTDRTDFFDAASAFLNDIITIAQTTKQSEVPASVFLEKTPHALLAPGFLTRIAPGSRLVHVMRDPRSIAYSLQSMPWGPNSLEGCCAWVSNYCGAWLGAERIIAEQRMRLTCVQIESIAKAQEEASQGVCKSLEVEPIRKLFHGADEDILNSWVTRCSEADFTLIDGKLSGWARHFGYDPEGVGKLISERSVYAA